MENTKNEKEKSIKTSQKQKFHTVKISFGNFINVYGVVEQKWSFNRSFSTYIY